MRIFILEDMETRNTWFRQNFIGNVIDFTMDVEEASELLSKNQYDVIFLDHDLADAHYDTWAKSQMTNEEYAEELENTGYDVAKWIAENNNNSQAQVIIHSCNEWGSKRMFHILNDKGYDVQCISFPNFQRRYVADA